MYSCYEYKVSWDRLQLSYGEDVFMHWILISRSDCTSSSGIFAEVVQSHLTVSDHSQGHQGRKDETLWHRSRHSPCQTDSYCTSGQWGMNAKPSFGFDWLHQHQQWLLPAGTQTTWVCISAWQREGDNMALLHGTHGAEATGDVPKGCSRYSEDDNEAWLWELHQEYIHSKSL